MNFVITWLFDKIGYMPKFDMEIGKLKLDAKTPEFKMWPFPVEEKPKKTVKRVAKKATTVAKKKTSAKTTKPKAQ